MYAVLQTGLDKITVKINVNNIKLPVDHKGKDLIRQTAKMLHLPVSDISDLEIRKRSIDARHKDNIRYIYSVNCVIPGAESVLRKTRNDSVKKASDHVYKIPEKNYNGRPVIIGAGPAGLFCAYICAEAGLCPVVIERGSEVTKRRSDVDEFWKTGVLKPDSNVQFGEGGAGTFSDGKLNTLVHDKEGRCRFVLETFVRFGAPAAILYDAKPHIGTDILIDVIRNMREYLISRGAEFMFDSCVTDLVINNGSIRGVVVTGAPDKKVVTDIASTSRISMDDHQSDRLYEIGSDRVVLAIGHSARDTFELIRKKGISIRPKPFAVGLRIEHPRRFIDISQYGDKGAYILPAAPYKLTAKSSEGRGVYTFCMCPGGYVVNASSEEGMLAVNGMSYSGRNGDNSNSAVIVTVTPDDFPSDDALSGVEFQRDLERRAYEAGYGRVPVQRLADYAKACGFDMADHQGYADVYGFSSAGDGFAPNIKGAYEFADVHSILPGTLNNSLMEGIYCFDRQIHGFASPDAYLSGVESRTSSPVRIERGEDGMSVSVKGLYPCGEGAGYAGGITSAAMDGMLIAERILLSGQVL